MLNFITDFEYIENILKEIVKLDFSILINI